MKALFVFKKMFWISAPFLLGVLMVLFNQIPTSLMPYYHQSFPFVTGLIFYFGIFNPRILNIFLVFLLGLLMDAITTLPFGFYAFGFVFIYFMVSLFQSYLLEMVFSQLWLMYSVLFFCTDVIWAFLFFLSSGIWVSSGFWFVQFILVVLTYPLFCRIYGFLNRKVLEVQ